MRVGEGPRWGSTALLVGSAALLAVLIVAGLRLQEAAISPSIASPSAPARNPLPEGPRQTEASVNLPRVGSKAARDFHCDKGAGAAPSSPAVCREVAVEIPASAQIRVTPYAKEEGTADWRPCKPVGDAPYMSCGFEGFRFLALNPHIVTGPNVTTVTWIAMNSSAEHSRDAQLLVEYGLPGAPAR